MFSFFAYHPESPWTFFDTPTPKKLLTPKLPQNFPKDQFPKDPIPQKSKKQKRGGVSKTKEPVPKTPKTVPKTKTSSPKKTKKAHLHYDKLIQRQMEKRRLEMRRLRQKLQMYRKQTVIEKNKKKVGFPQKFSSVFPQ